jgi:putative CocE/NonD family hydrolase
MPGTRYRSWYLSSQSGPGNSVNNGSLLPVTPKQNGETQLPWFPANGACSRSTSQWLAGLDELAAADNGCDTNNQQNEAQALTFTTPAMKRPYVLSGPMNARLFVSSTRPDTSLAVTVEDVAPDGTSTEITSGSLVASLRAVTRAPCGAVVDGCSVYAGGHIVEPWHPYTYASQKPMPSEAVQELQVEIFPTTAEIAPGHRLRLTLESGDAPHRLDTASTLSDSAGALDTLYAGPKYPSSLYLGAVPEPSATWAR